MASTVSNKMKYLLATKAIDFSADSFKIIVTGKQIGRAHV